MVRFNLIMEVINNKIDFESTPPAKTIMNVRMYAMTFNIFSENFIKGDSRVSSKSAGGNVTNASHFFCCANELRGLKN